MSPNLAIGPHFRVPKFHFRAFYGSRKETWALTRVLSTGLYVTRVTTHSTGGLYFRTEWIYSQPGLNEKLFACKLASPIKCCCNRSTWSPRPSMKGFVFLKSQQGCCFRTSTFYEAFLNRLIKITETFRKWFCRTKVTNFLQQQPTRLRS